MAESPRTNTTERMQADLDALHAQGQYRDLNIPRGIQLGSNDYLGLSTHPRLKDALGKALGENENLGSTGSRLLSGHSERWEQLEEEFAQFVGSEAALYFTSGYAANLGLLSSVLRANDTVFSDSGNHASLIDGIRLSRAGKVIFPHLDLGYLEDALSRDRSTGEKFVVVESIFSMDGDRTPLPALVELCERYGASLIVDEAHSIGVEGQHGRGSLSSLRGTPSLLAAVYTCGKALGSMGAFVCGSQTLKEFLINHARTFIYSTALPPYCAVQVREALRLTAEADGERKHLAAISCHLLDRLRTAGFNTAHSDSQIVPVILGSNEEALHFAAALTSSGFAVRAIRPPTVPAGSSRLRLSLNAKLSMEEMDALIDALVATREGEVVRDD